MRTKYLSLVEDKEKLSREVKRRQEDLERESEQRQKGIRGKTTTTITREANGGTS